MKAITTRKYGPTNTKGSRITASDLDNNRITLPYNFSLDNETNHRAAATALCTKMNWEPYFVTGAIKLGYVHVLTPHTLSPYIARQLERLDKLTENYVIKIGTGDCSTNYLNASPEQIQQIGVILSQS